MQTDDTIVAISTPAGRGGLGVVRLSGANARAIAETMLQLSKPLATHHATLAKLLAAPSAESNDKATSQVLDEIVATYFAAPNSYTKEDVVELSAHGSPVILRHIMERAMSAGARLAQPGEFTMRAFLNGRIDLTQAEAVRDLIESQTLHQAQTAAQQLGGALSREMRPVKEKLIQLIATLEAGIDFAEDDISVMSQQQTLEKIGEIHEPLAKLEKSFARGKLLHDGVALAIVGRPNVGKSILFNRLLERERAIVTASPGTTRDLVTESVAIRGVPVRLTDTAGLREASDEAEAIGVSRSYEALAEADLVLLVLESGAPVTQFERELLGKTAERRRILVRNKVDLGSRCGARMPMNEERVIATSALSGAGIEQLREAIADAIGASGEPETAMLTNVRQHSLVAAGLQALAAAETAARNAVPHEMMLLDLYGCLHALDELTGQTSADDILNLIFSTFCIGK